MRDSQKEGQSTKNFIKLHGIHFQMFHGVRLEYFVPHTSMTGIYHITAESNSWIENVSFK